MGVALSETVEQCIGEKISVRRREYNSIRFEIWLLLVVEEKGRRCSCYGEEKVELSSSKEKNGII
jgi:hypothetical protein